MRISPISNNVLSYKGSIKLVGPTGKSITMNPDDIKRISSENIFYYYIHSANNCAYKHNLAASKATFDDSQFFIVNAKEEELLKAKAEAKKLPEDECITVGKPLYPFLSTLSLRGIYNGLASNDKAAKKEYTKAELANYPNTLGVIDVGVGCYAERAATLRSAVTTGHLSGIPDAYAIADEKIVQELDYEGVPVKKS